MAKTYVPKFTDDVHTILVYMTRYDAIIRPALQALDPDVLIAYDAAFVALRAIDALRSVLTPIEP